MSDFREFPKIARLSRECVVTEKIDGTNAQILIERLPEGASVYDVLPSLTAVNPETRQVMYCGSRNRYITPAADNFGFATWAQANADALWSLGDGRHYGEWWGSGIQRGYGLPKGEKRFSLFNVARWHQVGAEPYISTSSDPRVAPKSSTEAPACCHVVPVLYRGEFDTTAIADAVTRLDYKGSVAAPGFKPAEGVIVYHPAANLYFKKTVEKDEEPKSLGRQREAVAR